MDAPRCAPREEDGEGDGGRDDVKGKCDSVRTKSYWCSIQE